ncbi:MAG: N-acetylmuramic acid 6-phosphate etherase [Maribacter sp.]|jgi:N-acetylmuramic acid 6-phosphate etherase
MLLNAHPLSELRKIGLIAGGDRALRRAVENAEDDMEQAWEDLKKFNICDKDVLLGIAASGTTPYVLGWASKS